MVPSLPPCVTVYYYYYYYYYYYHYYVVLTCKLCATVLATSRGIPPM